MLFYIVEWINMCVIIIIIIFFLYFKASDCKMYNL